MYGCVHAALRPIHWACLMAVLASVVAGATASAAATFTEQELYVQGQGGYAGYRIPAIVRTKSGALLAFCEGRRNSLSDSGDIDVLVRRSTDGGETWGEPHVVWSDGANTCGNPAPVVDMRTGTIHLLGSWNRGTDSETSIVNGTSGDTRRVFHMASDDDGLTWSAPVEITSTAKRSDWTWYATGPGAGVQLSRGAQAGRLVVPCDHIVAASKAFGVHVVYSDDGGATWGMGAVATSTASVRPNENLAVELVDPAPGGGSRLYFNARDHQGSVYRASTFSSDGGSTYEPADFQDAPAFATPVVQGALVRARGTDLGDPANRILFSCPNGTARSRMSIWSSSDEAASWSAPRLVYDGPSAYSCMASLPDGRIALLYERGSSSAYQTITLARFDEAWLDAPRPPDADPGAAFWNLEETVPGQACPTDPGAILDVHPDGHGLHMTASKAFPSVAGAPASGNGRALSFAADGGVRILDSATANRLDFGPADSFTIEVVCRIPAGSTQVGALVAKDVGALSPSWWLRVENGKARFLVADATAEAIVQSSAAINTGGWVHVAAVRDASDPAAKRLRVYVDGVLSGTAADTTSQGLANGNAVWIGRFNAGTRLLSGDVDFVRITPAALEPGAFAGAWTQFDADGDSLPDSFERQAAGTLGRLGGADADGDSRPDLLEFALGTDPLIADACESGIVAGPPPAGIEVHTLLRDLPPWLGVRLWQSQDLRTWSPAAATTVVEPLGDGTSRRIDRIDWQPAVQGAAFFRYEVFGTP